MPRFKVRQSELGSDKYLGWWFDTPADQMFLEKVLKAAGIETRYWSVDPREYFSKEGGLFLGGRRDRFVGHTKRQEDWRRYATKFCVSIAKELLHKTGTRLENIGLISVNSTTGWANPSIPDKVAAELGMPHSVRHTQILGQGCHAALPNLARCVEFLEGYKRSPPCVMMFAAELCSLTFRPFDRKDKGYRVAVCIFGDAVAGALLRRVGGTKNPVIIDYETYVDFRSFQEMSYEVYDEGMKFVLSKEVPRLVGEKIREPVDRLLSRNDLRIKDLSHVLIHPGGLAILREGYGALGLDLQKDGAIPLEINRRFGNCSSATILMCLKRLMESGEWRKKEYALMCSMGPGLTIETTLLQKGVPTTPPREERLVLR